MKPEGAKAVCATNMLSIQCLKQSGRLSLGRFYRGTVLFVCRSVFEVSGDGGVAPGFGALAAVTRFRCR